MINWFKEWWLPTFVIAITTLGIVLLLVQAAWRIEKGGVQDFDHQILATEISELRHDVHALQTQIAGKQ